MKEKYIILMLVVSIAGVLSTFAQETQMAENRQHKRSYIHVGFGYGLDYGGLGIKGEFLPTKYTGVFAGGGHNFLNPTYNVGISIRPFPDNILQPIAVAMYGYNGKLDIEDYNDPKTYYGFSAGIGGELKFGNHGRLYGTAILPFHSERFKWIYDEARRSPYIKDKPYTWPVYFSVGFNWAL